MDGRAIVRLQAGKQGALRAGRPWVYRGEIAHVQGRPVSGEVVAVEDAVGAFCALGFYHETSVLAVRVLSRRADATCDAAFFRARLEAACALRRRLADDPAVCRLVFAEADGLPGVIADRFGGVIVLSTLVTGMDARRDELAADLADLTGVPHVFERNDGPVRRLEGLPERVGPLRGEPPEEAEIREGAVRLRIDLRHGQKTGHFLDQRSNHLAFGEAVSRLLTAGPVRLLDAFCHTGGFGLQGLAATAAAGLPATATFLDSSESAVGRALANAALSGLAGATGLVGNAFDELRSLEAAGERFDAVVLDPPAFARGRSQLDAAYRGYKECNLRAIRLLAPGGLLCTCSCSQPVEEAMFAGMLADAAADAGRRLRVLWRRGAPPDHPGLLGAVETSYLRCWLLQAVD